MPRKRLSSGGRRGLKWQNQSQIETSPLEGSGGAEDVDVGASLRRLREERGLSIRALAEKSSLAVNTLSLIENGKSSPSVSTLQQISLALDIPITAFFESSVLKTNIAYLKAGNRPRATFDQGTLEDLGAGMSARSIEPFVLTLEPNAGNGIDTIVHTGYEFIYCLEGRLIYTIEGRAYLLEPGDSLLFEAHLPHRWLNVGISRSRSLLVLVPSDERDRPTERHFIPGSA